jgi:hypothetical protein
MDSQITCCFCENLTFMLSTCLWCSCKVLPTKSICIYVLWQQNSLIANICFDELKISQTSLGLHSKPKTSFCDHSLVHNPNWVWSKILDGDSNILQDYEIYTYFSSHFPSLLCSRTSIVQAWGRSHSLTQMLCKCYVAKSFEEQKKKWKKKKIMMRIKEK